eukprot:COSAG02_NODE_3780_length_6242_cov_10.962559_5_plen_85_part_00
MLWSLNKLFSALLPPEDIPIGPSSRDEWLLFINTVGVFWAFLLQFGIVVIQEYRGFLISQCVLLRIDYRYGGWIRLVFRELTEK